MGVALVATSFGATATRAAGFAVTPWVVRDSAMPVASEPGTTYSFQSRPTVGFGLTIEFPLSPRLGLEVGGMYVQRKYAATLTADDTGVTTVDGNLFSISTIEVPLGIRYWPMSWFGVGLGGYVAFGLDHVTVSDPSGNNPVNQTFSDTRLGSRDYGAYGSLRVQVPLTSWVGVALDGRYLLGLSNDAAEIAPNETFHNREFQAALGVAIGALK